MQVTLEKPPSASLGLALAPSKTGHLIVTDVPYGGLIQVSACRLPRGVPCRLPRGAPCRVPCRVPYGGRIQVSGADFRLGDMLVGVNGTAVQSLDSFVETMRSLSGVLTFELQRVEDAEALEILLRQVSKEQHRLELERRNLSLGIRASQEEDLLQARAPSISTPISTPISTSASAPCAGASGTSSSSSSKRMRWMRFPTAVRTFADGGETDDAGGAFGGAGLRASVGLRLRLRLRLGLSTSLGSFSSIMSSADWSAGAVSVASAMGRSFGVGRPVI